MVKRSSSQLALEILHALVVDRTVDQGELAQKIGVRSETIRVHLKQLKDSGVPLTRDVEDRKVKWSIPPSWVPGGVFVSHEDAFELTRVLSRSSKSEKRDLLLKRLASAVVDPARAERLSFVKGASFECRWDTLIYKARVELRALHVRYFTMSRGDIGDRYISVAAELPPQRIVARCHRSNTLKWFRTDNIMGARIDLDEPYRDTPKGEVDAFIGASVNGYNNNEPLTEHAFHVREPESRWVKLNLPDASSKVTELRDHPGHIRVVVSSSAVMPVARYVLSLGDAARAESEPLRSLVRTLAQAVLAQLERE